MTPRNHTDRGTPYASHDYQERLSALGIECSMSRKGDCYDNAVMESWFARYKNELGEDFESVSSDRRLGFEYIEVFYNQRRRHSALGYQTPAEVERAFTFAPAKFSPAFHNKPQAFSPTRSRLHIVGRHEFDAAARVWSGA